MSFYEFLSKSLIKASFVASISILFFSLIRPFFDPDLGWHLRQGQIVVSERRFLETDEFSWTMTGFKWPPYWLSDVVIFEGYQFFGLSGLAVIFAFIGTLSILVPIFFFFNRNYRLASFVIFVSTTILIAFGGIRPQVISWFFSSVLMTLLVLERYKTLGQLIIFPLLFVFWTNFHYGFLLGLALIFLALVAEWIDPLVIYLKNFKFTFPKDRMTRSFRLVLILVLSFLATLLNPAGFNSHKSAYLGLSSKVNTANIMEWLPLNFKTDVGLVSILFLFFVFWLVIVNFNRLTGFEKSSFFFLAVSALLATRNVPFFLIISVIIILKSSLPNLERYAILRFLSNLYYPLTFILVCFILGFNSVNSLIKDFDLAKLSKKSGYPYDAVVYLSQFGLPGKRVLNEYNWGGFLIWQLPEMKTFIDGRMPSWKQDGRSILVDYLNIYNLSAKTDQLLSEYQIDWAILSRDAPITNYFKLSGWNTLYEDNQAIILKKK